MDLAEYDQIIKSLVAIAGRMDIVIRRMEEHNADIKTYVQQQTIVNAQNTTLINRISRTLDQIDEKLDRIFPEPTAR